MPRHPLVIALTGLILVACSDQPPEHTTAAETSKLPQDNVFKPSVNTMERARAVEQTLQQGAERQRRLLEAQGD